LKERLLNLLLCLNCCSNLRLDGPVLAENYPWREIIEARLICPHCQEIYPVINGVPRMTNLNTKSTEVQKTVDGFGYEWQTFNHQIQTTYMSTKENFLDFIFPTTESIFRGKTVLDAGCGMGRFLKIGADLGCQEIIGVDLSNSVEAAYQNSRHLPNAHVVQADIMQLPFRSEFDYIFSIGVLQFLSNPESGFHALVNRLKPGGRISIWVYSKENNEWVIRFINPLREKITSRIPHKTLYRLSCFLGFVYYLLLRLTYKPANEWKLLQKIGIRLPYNDYFYYNLRLSSTDLASIVFDHLVPQLTSYLSREEIIEWFQKDGLKELEISSRNNMSWRAHGTL
jgi:SAM-dependent methyltransferase